MSSIVRTAVILLARYCCADSRTSPCSFINDYTNVGWSAFCMTAWPCERAIDDGLGGAAGNLTNPQTLRIPKTGALAIVPSSPGRAATILMNPPTLKIHTKHTLAETCSKMNVITKFLNCVVPRFTCTPAPLVDMVIIELAIIIQSGKNVVMSGKNLLMMPSPAMLMCSD
jgi:hypothetical protein